MENGAVAVGLNTSDDLVNTPNSILIHCGPWAKSQFFSMAGGLDPDAVVFASLYPSCDDVGLKFQFIDEVENASSEMDQPEDTDLEESILRCRFLRNIPRKKAIAYRIGMDRVWARTLEKVRPRFVLSELIDSFVIESLERTCNRLDIPFLGIVTSFVDGYFRITRYGELVPWRVPSKEEVTNVSRMLLAQGYVPKFARTSGSVKDLTVIKRWISTWLRASYLGMLSLYPPNRVNNMIYGGFITARQRLHLLPRIRLGSPSWRDEAHTRGRPVIMVPLQLVPESTVDYWTHDVEKINYHQTLLHILNRLENRFTFLVKEHPNVLGLRHPDLYRDLERRSDVVFADTWSPSSDVLEICDGVLVWTGSMGFEAALRGKPVIALTPVYYMSGDRFMVYDESTTPAEVDTFVREIGARPISRSEQYEMVRHLLSGLVEGRIVFRRNFEEVKENYTDPVVIGEQIRLVADAICP